jgi:dTDP-glucose 4,6-dehydratase
LGNPVEISILDFAKEVLALTGADVEIVHEGLPIDDPKKRRPDISRAKEVLNWEPTIDRSEGLKRTFDYFKSLTPEELTRNEHKNFEAYIKK